MAAGSYTGAVTPRPERDAVGGSQPVGLWLSHGRLSDVNSWAAKTVVPVVVTRMGLHTVLVPRGRSAIGAPYDDAATLCAARPAPSRLAPAIGFWVIEERAVITVQLSGWRRQVRWVVWDPERGVLRPPGVESAGPAQVLRAAGGGARRDLVEMLAERHHPPARLLAAVVSLLGLPGAEVLLDPSAADRWTRVQVHDPAAREVAYFEDSVKHAVALRRELGFEQ
ncbi:hypothetical protein BH23ACT6_BH23ACT6_24230 [soil metagenome]